MWFPCDFQYILFSIWHIWNHINTTIETHLLSFYGRSDLVLVVSWKQHTSNVEMYGSLRKANEEKFAVLRLRRVGQWIHHSKKYRNNFFSGSKQSELLTGEYAYRLYWSNHARQVSSRHRGDSSFDARHKQMKIILLWDSTGRSAKVKKVSTHVWLVITNTIN